MDNFNYASIVPLIGGETIAMENVFGKRPEHIMSYTGFQANEEHLLNHYNNEVPYHILDEGKSRPAPVDVVNTVCPCAGLSSLSPQASSDNHNNDWMRKSTDYVLSELKPKVLWGENAPRLASKMGKPVVADLRGMAEKYGYTFSIYQTKSILHGLSQVRDRTFYFFWRGNKTPVLDWIEEPHEKIEDAIRNVNLRPDDPMSTILTNEKKPTDNPFYKYCLEEIEGGISHSEFQDKIEKSTNPLDHIERHTNYKVVGVWMKKNGYDNEASKCERMYEKLKSGGNIMRKTTEIPKDYIGAFVGHMPSSLTHPDEDRYLYVREALAMMKMPDDFQLLNPKRSLNHICQNVPVTTAEHAAKGVKAFLEGRLDNRLLDTDFILQNNKAQKLDYQLNTSLEEFFG